MLVQKGAKIILEGANMPTTNEAIQFFHSKDVILAPAKACNAGGVAVSGLEMAQNATMTTWSSEDVDERLRVRVENVLHKEKGLGIDKMLLICRWCPSEHWASAIILTGESFL
jgi:glutamate dehydrogenase (NADP+)